MDDIESSIKSQRTRFYSGVYSIDTDGLSSQVYHRRQSNIAKAREKRERFRKLAFSDEADLENEMTWDREKNDSSISPEINYAWRERRSDEDRGSTNYAAYVEEDDRRESNNPVFFRTNDTFGSELKGVIGGNNIEGQVKKEVKKSRWHREISRDEFSKSQNNPEFN